MTRLSLSLPLWSRLLLQLFYISNTNTIITITNTSTNTDSYLGCSISSKQTTTTALETIGEEIPTFLAVTPVGQRVTCTNVLVPT